MEREKVTVRERLASDGPVFTEAERAQGWHTDVSKFEEELRHQEEGRCVCLTAEWEGEPAGYVSVYLSPIEGPFADKGWPEINDLCVLQKYQGKGIGRALMDAAEALAARYSNTVCLSVGLHAGYGRAQRMYVLRGYMPDGSGVWYRGKPCTPYDTVYTNDDDLVLYLSKDLRS